MSRKWKIILILSLVANLSIVYVGYKALEYRAHINHFLDKYLLVTAELSGRAVFESENQPLQSDSTVENRIVFFGTQVIRDWDLNRYFADFEASNRGIGGQRVAGYILRLRPDVIELKPKAVLIEVSSYNLRPESSVREVTDYVASLAELARLHNIEPLLTTGIPLRKGADDFGDYVVMDSLRIYNQWLKDFCRDNNYYLVDFTSVLADSEGFLKPELSANVVEPNDLGYERMAEATRKVLEQLYQSR